MSAFCSYFVSVAVVSLENIISLSLELRVKFSVGAYRFIVCYIVQAGSSKYLKYFINGI